MAVFTDEQVKEIEKMLQNNASKIAEYVLKDQNFLNQLKKIAVEELQQRLKS